MMGEEKVTSKNFWKEIKQMDERAEIRHYSRAELKAYDRMRQQKEQSFIEEQSWALGDWEYHWQGNGMLKSVRTPTGEWIHYEYDALGRRTAKLIGDKIYRYLWEGNTLLHEWHYPKFARPKIETDELGWFIPDHPEPVENLTTWVYEEGSLVPVAKLANGEKYSIIADYIGRPVQAYDDQGKIVWEAEYDIYGNIRKQSGIKDKNFVPFRQLGQYEDEETGLYYNRHRYYNPETGQYISQDPIRLNGGLTNLYGYVSDPNTWVDIFGLDCNKGFKMSPKKKSNKIEGLRREDTLKRVLEDTHGKDRVLSERMLLDVNGNKVVAPSGTGRRVDFIVLGKNGNAIKSYEVTSKTARKTAQVAKENFIRNNGGTFIKDRNGNLVDISNVPTQIIRIK